MRRVNTPGAPDEDNNKKFTFAEQKELVKSFVKYYPKHKKLFTLDLSIVIVSPIFATLMPWIVYKAMEELKKPASEIDGKFLTISVILIFALTLLNISFEYIKTRFGHVLGVRMESDMRTDMFAHLQKLSFTYFDKTKTGQIMSRISNDLTTIAEVAHHAPEDIISAFIMLVGSLVVMININPLLTLLALLPVPFAIFWTGYYQPKMRRFFRSVRREVAEINSQVENSIQGVREVKSYTNEPYEIEKFGLVNGNYVRARENVFSMMAMFHSGMAFLFHGYSIIFIGIAIYMIYLGKADPAQVIAFYMYSGQITMPVMRLVGFVEQYQQGMTAFERFREVMNEKPDIMDKPAALSEFKSPLKGAIRFENVFFKYAEMKEDEKFVLDDINVEIPPGSTLALVGESGAGKTTFAALVPRFYEAQKGTVSIDGISVADMTQKLLRSNVGIVQQTPFLFDATIRENILFGKPSASEDELVNAAKLANIYDFIMTLPDKFESHCGENGVKLSGGQRQRISIARVFLKNPPVLIFDEATSALDNESEALVQASMERLCENRTTIIIAHRLSTIKNADYICCMKHGKVVEKGTHQELLALDGYYKELYTMHSF